MNEKLAINGGEPVRKKIIAYGRQWIDEKDIESVINVLKSDFLTTGPKVTELEEAVSKYTGSKYAVAVSNGTAALHAACFAAGITEGDEVLVPPITFAASSNCVLYCKGRPVFVDIDPKTYNINVDEVERYITPRTKAIIPVDFAGQPADLDRIKKIADKYKLVIIEDAAHALGSEYKGQKIGSLSDMTEFSLHPVKPITTGEGGIITTDSEDYYKKLLLFRSHGITRDSNLSSVKGDWYYEQMALGYNYRITDIQCALGVSQLDKLDMFIMERRKIAARYNEAFKDMEELVIPYQDSNSNSGWHLYIIKLNLETLNCDRNQIYKALLAENIGVNVHYIPVYFHPYYESLGYKKGICPEAEMLFEQIITLPLFPKMIDEDIEDVIHATKKVINYYRKI